MSRMSYLRCPRCLVALRYGDNDAYYCDGCEWGVSRKLREEQPSWYEDICQSVVPYVRDPKKVSDALQEFHEALHDERGRGNAALRLTLHEEEHEELLDELSTKRPGIEVRKPKADSDVDREKLARELADVVYVAYGTAHAFALDLDAAIAEIHRATMTKLNPTCQRCEGRGWYDVWCDRTHSDAEGVTCGDCSGTGKGERVVRSDGKICKPPGFVAPDMSVAV